MYGRSSAGQNFSFDELNKKGGFAVRLFLLPGARTEMSALRILIKSRN